MISDCQIVVVVDEDTERAMTMLEALLRLRTEARGGRPERCEEPVEDDGDVPEFVPQE